MQLQFILIKTRNWRQFLLEEPLHPDLPELLPAFLKISAKDFFSSASESLASAAKAQLNRWYASSEGQSALVGFTKALWAQMEQGAPRALPAHDARHAMFKVPATSIQYMASENLAGWERIGIIGALLHDYGRWAEERIYGGPQAGHVHATLSYLLGNELLARFDMPVQAKQHILLCAIRHSAGANVSDSMPLKLTVSADRDQLYGPEIVLRLSHHTANQAGDLSSFYGETPGQSVLDKLEPYLLTRRPGPLFSRQTHVDSLWSILATFFLIAEDADTSRARFSKGMAAANTIPAASRPFDWETEWTLANDLRPVAKSPALALMKLLQAPNVAPAETFRQGALGKLSRLSAKNANNLACALTYIEEERWVEDQRQLADLKRIEKANASDRLVLVLAGLLIENWAGTRTTDSAAHFAN